MQCVVLAGGLGTRMRPRTETLPKALLPVNGRPFVDHQLSLLAAEGVTHVVLCIGYLGHMIREVVGRGDRWGLQVEYVDEGRDLRGTAGALRMALDAGRLAEEFLVLYGDSYLPIAYRPVLEALRAADAPALVTVLHNADRWDTSNVVFEEGKVVLYDKHRIDPRGLDLTYIDYGLAALTRSLVADCVEPGPPVDLADFYHDLSLRGELAGYEVATRFYEVGSPQGLAELEVALRSGLRAGLA